MSIVLREDEWAERVISSPTLGKVPYVTLRRVARYYLDQGYSKTKARQKLEEFLIRYDPKFPLRLWNNTLTTAVNYAVKHPAINIDGISISKEEMDTINSIDGKMNRRVAFTLLCLQKYQIILYGEKSWVTQEMSEVMRLANINTSTKRQCAIYYYLKENGYIQTSKKVNDNSVKVLFMNDGEQILRVTDFTDLGYQYLMYLGEPFFRCELCGKITKLNDPKNRRRQKYCNTCANKMLAQQRTDAVMRCRAKKEAVRSA